MHFHQMQHSGFTRGQSMKQFLSTTQIAKLEDVTPTTVQRWVRDGFFPNARKVGRVFRIPLDDYHRWRESTKINSNHPSTSGRTDRQS